MADIDDVTATFSALAADACFPLGPNAPSVIGGNDIFIAQGWPKQAALEKQIAAGITNVSVYATAGGKGDCFQILDSAFVVRPAVHGMTATTTLAGFTGTVTIAGTPGRGEYLTIVADGNEAYSRVGETVAVILAALLADILPDYPGATVVGNSISLPTTRLDVHIGAPATMGRITHRQKTMVSVTVWAPSPQARSNVGSSIEVALCANNRLVMPDNTQATYSLAHTNQTDVDEVRSIYRRDVVFECEYGTLETFEAFEITSVGISIDNTLDVVFSKTTG